MHMQIELTEKDFSNFSKLIYDKCGINLHNGKRELLKARLATILRKSDFTSVKDYYRYLTEKASDQEIIPLLNTAKQGIYDKDRVGKIPYQLQRAYFKKGIRKWQGFYRVKPELQKVIKFERFNLMDPFPSNHTFDVVFLRNVMIYFDKPTQEKLVNKCYDIIEKDGYFFIGHSESLTGVKHKFKYIEPSVYRK